MTASATLEIPSATLERREEQTVNDLAVPALKHLDRVVLTGFMGSGKTTVGRLLAERLGWHFHDLDDEIERRAGLSVPDIFAHSGEEGFRRLESAALAHLLGEHRCVLALGGGSPEVLGNRLLLEQTPRTAVVYLHAPLETLLDRCRRDAATERPLLGIAAERLPIRHPLYERIAAHRVATTQLDAVEVVAEVLRSLTPLSRPASEAKQAAS